MDEFWVIFIDVTSHSVVWGVQAMNRTHPCFMIHVIFKDFCAYVVGFGSIYVEWVYSQEGFKLLPYMLRCLLFFHFLSSECFPTSNGVKCVSPFIAFQC